MSASDLDATSYGLLCVAGDTILKEGRSTVWVQPHDGLEIPRGVTNVLVLNNAEIDTPAIVDDGLCPTELVHKGMFLLNVWNRTGAPLHLESGLPLARACEPPLAAIDSRDKRCTDAQAVFDEFSEQRNNYYDNESAATGADANTIKVAAAATRAVRLVAL